MSSLIFALFQNIYYDYLSAQIFPNITNLMGQKNARISQHRKGFKDEYFFLTPSTLQIVGIIFVLIGALLVSYPFWTDEEVDAPLAVNESTESSQFDLEPEDLSLESESGRIGDGISTTRGNEISEADDPNVSVDTQVEWIATDYEYGDIDKNLSYEVEYGDTLWEISEAVYGSGDMWTEILKANDETIGCLGDGTQALIFPGQTLNIS